MLYSTIDGIFAKEHYGLERGFRYETIVHFLDRTKAWDFYQREDFEETAKTVCVFKEQNTVRKVKKLQFVVSCIKTTF